jgi:hypothetical protein
MRILTKVIIVISFLLFASTIQTQAQDSLRNNSNSWDRFSVNIGGFLATYNSGIAIGSKQLGLGVQIDIEDALGIESSTFAFRGEAKYKFGKTLKHSATFGYFGILRNSRKVLDEELVLGNIIYPIGTEINSKYDLTILRAKYDYAFFQDDRISLGASFGFFIMPVNLTVNALYQEEHKTQFTAPLPLLGIRTDFKITEKLYLNQSVEILYLSFDDFTGGILDLNVAVEHKTFSHIAFGIGVNSNRVNMEFRNQESSANFFGDIRMDYTGLLFYGKYYL